MGDTVENPEKPFVAILGGAKVSDKLRVIENLMRKVNSILIGGGMAYTFFKAQGKTIGDSLCEDDFVDKALGLLEQAKEVGCRIVLPVDTVVGKEFKSDTESKVVEGNIDSGWQGLDIGPQTCELFAAELKDAKTIVWNGPMGVFEMEAFAAGTKAVALAVVEATRNGARSVIGGGDSATAIMNLGLQDQVSHISVTGEPARATGDPGRVRQIIRNLVSNALRYGGAEVRIEVSSDVDAAKVFVYDSGPSIPFEDRELIFEQYQRASNVVGPAESLGLGLSISRKLARYMSGDLTYRHENEESVFELSLPRAD